MESVTFKTSQGTEIEVRNINVIATLDYLQAAFVVLDQIEQAIADGGVSELDTMFAEFIGMEGGLFAVFPPQEDKNTDSQVSSDLAPSIEELLKEMNDICPQDQPCPKCGLIHN